MKEISVHNVREAVTQLCLAANVRLPADMRNALQSSFESERGPLAKRTLLRILQNADTALERQLPLCQDTGLVVVFAELGQEVLLVGGGFRDAIDDGVRDAWKRGKFRASVSPDPINRGNSGDNTPAVVHVEVVPGDRLVLRLLAKGGGCENMSRFKMLTPADGVEGVEKFVIDSAIEAGPNACPPMVVGVGIGGSFEYSALLSKRALLRMHGFSHPLKHIAQLEQRIFNGINASGVGPQGYGGDTTVLAVHIEVAAAHIASLPVSINIECHAHRCQEVTL